MELLRSSLIGKEFINYRKSTVKDTRLNFSTKVRQQGLGNVPIVIDSVECDITDVLSEKVSSSRYKTYGRELIFNMEGTLEDVLKHIKIVMLKRGYTEIDKLTIGLEDGTFPSLDSSIGDIYKAHRNKDDRILYLLLSKEQSIYGYIMSILRYLKKIIFTG